MANLIQQAQERTESFYEEFPVDPGDVVFLGDSLTEQANWYELFPQLPVKNRGVGGATTEQILELLHQVTSGQPAKIFVMMGTNDLNMEVPEQTIIANYELLMSRVKRESPSTELYVQSLLPREPAMQERVEALNRQIQRSAEQRALEFLNFYPEFLGEDGGIAKELANDELHLMAEGYRIWQRLLSRYLAL